MYNIYLFSFFFLCLCVYNVSLYYKYNVNIEFSIKIYLVEIYLTKLLGFKIRVMLHSQIILQHFYKMLMWLISYWFSFRPIINNTFSFTNNYSPYQQFCKKFCKIVCISSIILKIIIVYSIIRKTEKIIYYRHQVIIKIVIIIIKKVKLQIRILFKNKPHTQKYEEFSYTYCPFW